MAQLNWHDAAAVRTGARIAQLLILGLVTTVVFAAGFGVVLSEGHIQFTVTPTELIVDADPGILAQQRRASLASIQEVSLASPQLGLRTNGTAKPGHCSGWFQREELGRVWEASACTRDTVVVRLPDETWTLGPADRQEFAHALRTATPGVFEIPPPPPLPVWWRALQLLILATFALPLLLLAAVLVPIRYAASAGTLYVRSPVGTRRFDIGQARASIVNDPRIGWRVFGMGMPGASLGIFRVDGTNTHVWATRRGGPAVLVEGPRRVMVTPADPPALLDDLRSAGAT